MLKSDPRPRAVLVVVFTSSHESSDLEKSDRLGVNSRVVKPADHPQFARVLCNPAKDWPTINQRPPVSTDSTDSTHE